jgi:8-oxo-dGTP pyrophosphatase MutT (NUDIX family)
MQDKVMSVSHAVGRVVRAGACDLLVEPGTWEFAERNRDAIAAHWRDRLAGGAAYFDGTIHLMRSHSLDRGVFSARLLRTDFKSYLYWRDTGFADESVADAFGSALIRSTEGHVMLGRQREGNINEGLAYLPGGFIDVRDVDPAGKVDIEASVARELEEETGLSAAALERVPGFVLTFAGPLVSVGVELRSPLSSAALKAAILTHLAADPRSELADIVVVRSAADLAHVPMPGYALTLLSDLFAKA